MRRHLITAVVAAWFLTGFSAQSQETEPPARVGRIASLSGTVSFHLAGAERWERASPNLPLTDGAALWTQPGATATIGVTGNRIALDAATEFDFDRLDEHSLVATQPQGESYWRLAALPGGDSASLQTPRGIVTFAAAGRYAVVSGDTERPTEITVLEGAAKVTGLAANVEIGPNQTLSITGDGVASPFVPTLRAAMRDAFAQRMLAAERPPARHLALPPGVAEMTGSEILAEAGEWGESPDYGPVWYPPAPAGFVPYRDGHWAYVAPWGWTWVDDAPWGFAPTHYGRWAEIDGRWGWVPGREWAAERPPVYAPALVGFIAGAAGSWVGWVPLGPREAYRPAYHVGPRAAEALNRPTGAAANVTVVNRQAVTVVPAQAMANSVNVARVFRAVPPKFTAGVQFRAPVAPTRATIGATPAVLHDAGPRESEAPERTAAPGPAIGAPVGRPGHAGAALLSGAAAGGSAALLLRPSAPRAALPELRPHRSMPSAAPGAPFAPASPQPPVLPQTPGRPQATMPTPERPIFERPEPRPAQVRPEPARPMPPRAEPARIAPVRPEPPRVEPPRPPPARQPAPVEFRAPPRPMPEARPSAPPPRPHREEPGRRRP